MNPTTKASIPENPIRTHQWLQIFFVTFLFLLLHQVVEQGLTQQMERAMQKESSLFVITAGGLLLNSLGLLWLHLVVLMGLLLPQQQATQNIALRTKIGDFTREWLRSLGDASLWSFAFILPGLMRWIDYSLLPFVCFFDPLYQSGSVDALHHCRALAHGHRLRLWGLWLGFGVVLPLIISSLLGPFRSFFATPVQAVGLVFIEGLTSVLSFWMLWRIYLRVRTKSTALHSTQSSNWPS